MDYDSIWNQGNNSGEGYAVGGDNDDINSLDIGSLIVRADTDTGVAVYERESGSLTAVGDANGPWAVDIAQ